ncbi:hypothetical protein Hanom_Chr14g01298291 [Helianthus anomalus]
MDGSATTVTRMWTKSMAVLTRRKPSSQMGLPRLTMAAMFVYQILRPRRSYMEKRGLHIN